MAADVSGGRSSVTTFDLRIDSIAAGGDGVGRHEGLVVFVPRTAPGDVVRVDAEQDGRLMRGRLLDVIQAAADRTEPPCGHYVHDRCGGCQIQHLSYAAQLQAKSGIVDDAMTRIGRAASGKPDVDASPREWRYRTKLTLAMRLSNGEFIAGLHRYDVPEEIFSLTDCPITDERVMTHWRSILGLRDLLPSAPELRGAVRLSERGFTFTLEGGTRWSSHEEFFRALTELEELWWIPDGQRRERLAARAPESRAGASFIQINPHVAGMLRAWVVKLAGAHSPQSVVDAYAGTGDTASMLATSGVRVTAIEIDRDAARVCATRLPQGSRTITGRVENALPKAIPADVVILNPPRAGLHELVPRTLNGSPPKARAVIYVSCNPATLARDVRRMDGWRVRSLRAFDMFPQTAHVETVCELVPAA
jgi:23S rRNA (uracil1939-C5)-methyltransferase